MRSMLLLCVLSFPLHAQPLPGTQPLTDDRDLAKVMVDGIHLYLNRDGWIGQAERRKGWKPDFTSTEAFSKSLEPFRVRLKRSLGIVDKRESPKLEYVGGPNDPSLIAETVSYSVHRVRWPVLAGVYGEGLLLEPKGKALANIVALPHCSETPEQLVGLEPGREPQDQFARRLAENRCRVIVPVTVSSSDELSGNARLNRWTNQSHREFIHRMGYEMGRTTIGYESQMAMGAVDWFESLKDGMPLAAVGTGSGGDICHYIASLDKRITDCLYSGTTPDEGPLDATNFWASRDGDHFLAYMPNRHRVGPERPRSIPFNPARQGRTGAAPATSGPTRSKEEYRWTFGIDDSSIKLLLARRYDAFSADLRDSRTPWEHVLKPFLRSLTGSDSLSSNSSPTARRTPAVRERETAQRQKRLFDSLVNHTQNLWRNSEPIRKDFWKKADASSPEAWDKSCDWYRDYFHEEIIGKLPEPTMPLNPRSRQVYDEPKFTGHELMLDVYPDVIAQGILLLPKDLKQNEKRPVVVCQHGLEGRPRDCIDAEPKRVIYDQFARKLVEKGYIVYCPQNPYIFDDRFRQILRKANPLKLSLFSFIIRQHQRTLDYLETLPNVDPKRIAFYGLSYGGKTAMRVPAVEKRYCLSICSADFNEWIGKIVSTELPMSYMFTKEYDMLEFNLGHTFNYAEMAGMIAPRPFMVERGHDDGVGTDEMVAYEYAKVRYLYANRLKIPGRTDIEFFPGGHRINGVGTFAFLRKHLKWPE